MARSGAEAQLGSGHARPACGDQPLSESSRAIREGRHSGGVLYSGRLFRTFLGCGERTAVIRRRLGLEAGSDVRWLGLCLGGGLPPSLAPPCPPGLPSPSQPSLLSRHM